MSVIVGSFMGWYQASMAKVSAVSGPNLDQIDHVVTGLPVSDHDHGVNGIVFGDNGEIYIQVPGNTNAGIPGTLSSRKQLEEEILSASTVVASNVNSPSFDGHITYDSDDNQISGFDVRIFAAGQRNSYGIVLHSNGFLYATDNGANRGYGKSSVSCTAEGESPNDVDKLNLVVEGNYYGHANRKRGQTDPRQCKWRSANETSDDEYTAPIATLPASSDGLCEFETEHFAGQLRGNLIVARWKGELYNAALSDDGLTVENKGPSGIPPVLIDEDALDVVQGPDGTLFTAKHQTNSIKFYSPVESTSPGLKVKSVFPRRGSIRGGSTLTLYGDHLYTFGFPSVMVGGDTCAVNSPTSDAKITCTLPAGAGTVDIVVTSGLQSNVLRSGYRYINGEVGERSKRAESNPNAAPVTSLPPPPHSSAPVSLPGTSPVAPIAPIAETVDSLIVWALVWVNADTDEDIGEVSRVCDECFDLSSNVTIRADTWGDVNSVKMVLEGPLEFVATKNNMPHCLFGDKSWDYQGRIFERGIYTVTAQAFSAPDGKGLAGEMVSIEFEIK